MEVWIVFELWDDAYEVNELERVHEVCSTEKIALRVKKDAEKQEKKYENGYRYDIVNYEVTEK